MNPQGPFFVPKGQQQPNGFTEVVAEDYLPVLGAILVFEASGGVNFDRAVEFCLSKVL